MPEIGLVTVYWPFTMTGAGELVVQAGEARFVVDCRVNPVALVGHVTITFESEGIIVSLARVGGLTDIERIKIVPLFPLPPNCVTPYRVLLPKTSPPIG